LYSKKVAHKILYATGYGRFSEEEATMRAAHLIAATQGSLEEGNYAALYFLADKEEGYILDAKYEVYGKSALIAALETLTELVTHKYYDVAGRITIALIEKELMDKNGKEPFPPSTFTTVNLVIDLLDTIVEKCQYIPLAHRYETPRPQQIEQVEGGYPGFLNLPIKAQMDLIEEVLKGEIRPYIELDGGDVELLNFLNNKEVVIAYKGNCTSCFSATGATLSYIQQTLCAKLHPDLVVVPQF
jgi:NifU-like protein